jgi:hypothetical protein
MGAGLSMTSHGKDCDLSMRMIMPIMGTVAVQATNQDMAVCN